MDYWEVSMDFSTWDLLHILDLILKLYAFMHFLYGEGQKGTCSSKNNEKDIEFECIIFVNLQIFEPFEKSDEWF